GHRFFPKAKSPNECVGVVDRAATRRQLFQLLDVASTEDDFVRFDRSNQALHDIGHITSPFLLAVLFQSSNPDVIFKGGLLIRQVAQLHWFDDAIDNQGGSKTGSQAEKEHLAALVTSQSLHGGIVDDLHGMFEGGLEVETDPSLSEIPRFRNRPASQDRSRVTDGYDVVLPIRHEFPNDRDHSPGCQRGSGIKFSMSVLSSGQ